MFTASSLCARGPYDEGKTSSASVGTIRLHLNTFTVSNYILKRIHDWAGRSWPCPWRSWPCPNDCACIRIRRQRMAQLLRTVALPWPPGGAATSSTSGAQGRRRPGRRSHWQLELATHSPSRSPAGIFGPGPGRPWGPGLLVLRQDPCRHLWALAYPQPSRPVSEPRPGDSPPPAPSPPASPERITSCYRCSC